MPVLLGALLVWQASFYTSTELYCFMQPSIDSSNMANGIQSDRSITPVLPDFTDPTGCYLQNPYHSNTYYYGGKFVL